MAHFSDGTLNIAIAEMLEQGKISKRTNIEIDSVDYEDENVPYGSADDVKELASIEAQSLTEIGLDWTHITEYNEGQFEYTDWDNYKQPEEDE